MKRSSKWKLVTTLTLFFSLISFVAGTHEAKALIVSPARLEIEADPGETVSSKFTLINNQEDTKVFYSSAENFEAQDETGVPSFVPSEEGLDTWISKPGQVTLEPKERKEIPFTIKVPIDAGVGGHFAAVFWATEPPQTTEGGQVAVGAKVGQLVFLRVRGDITEKGEIVEFNSLTDKKFYDTIPVDFYYRFENSGNDRTKPVGAMVVKNMFGRVTETISANEKEGSVLPESIRKFFISWGRNDSDSMSLGDEYEKGTLYPKQSFFEKLKNQVTNFAFGRYTATLDLDYGLQKNQAQAKYSFYIIPWQLLLVVTAILFVINFGGKKMLGRYKRSIIKKHQNENEK